MDRRGDARSVPIQAAAPGRGKVQFSGLRDPGRGEFGGPQGEVPSLRSPELQRQGGGKGSPISAKSAGQVRTGNQACDVIFAPLASGDGVRVGLVGDTGCGKSYAAHAIAEEYLRRSRGVLAVADSKADGGWPGDVRASVDDLRMRPPGSRQIVFTPNLNAGELLDLETVAQWQWALAARGTRNCVVYDELSDACDDGEWLDGVRMLPRAFTHGRSRGISVVWGAQFAQLVPRQAWECSSVICCWRQYGNALAILKRRGYADDAAERAIASLPGDDVPKAQRGRFVVLRRGRPWDGFFYRF